MSTALAPRRLIVSASRFDSREVIVTAAPHFLPDPNVPPITVGAAPISPPLLSFDGASFMADFLAAAAHSTNLPALLAWRDWAEPPSAMLDVTGAIAYPPTIKRAAPLVPPIVLDPKSAGDLDPDGVPKGTPPWLRKLYLPLHLRFSFVAFDLVCQRRGWPPVDRARVKASGAVVRRLARDPTRVRWQDWISVDGKRGMWFELTPGLPADPDAIPSTAWGGKDAEVRARLGLSATAALPTALDSVRMTLLPLKVARAASHTTPYGYVPVYSAAEQVPDEPMGADATAIATALAADVTTQLTADWAGASGIRGQIRNQLSTLLGLTVLPPAPAPVKVVTSRLVLAALALVTPAQIDAAVADVVRTVLKDAAASLTPAAGALPGTGDATAFLVAAEIPTHWSTANGAINGTFTSNPFDWNVLIVDRLTQAAETVLLPTGAVSANPDQLGEARALLALMLLRTRGFRMGLLSKLYNQMSGDPETASLTAIATVVVGGTPYQIPAATISDLAAEIEAAYGLDSVTSPSDAVQTWSPLDRSQPANADAVHQVALRLENLFAPIDAAGMAGGSAYETRISAIIGSPPGEPATTLATMFGLPAGDAPSQLRTLGLELFEQPARGLLVFPGPTPTDADFTAMIAAAAGVYTSNVAGAVDEVRGRAKVHRLRYDHDSLYSIWCWARIAGRSDCENDRVVWTSGSEPFSLAEPTDVLGAKPATVQLPDLPRLIRDIPRIAKAGAKPFVAFNTPANSSFNVGDDPKKTTRAWGVGWICSFGIPVLTICAFILFSIIFSILIIIPGFAWMLLLKFCIPIPVPKKS